MTIKEIVQRLKTAMDDARGQESHFESWLTQNEGICDAIDALKELDKTEQEPVAWIWEYANGEEEVVFVPPRHVDATHVDAPSTITSLYTTPPQRKPLTDEEIGSCIDEVNLTSQYGHHHFGWHKQFARAIEAAHNIKGEA